MTIQGIQIWCSKTREEIAKKKIFPSNQKPDIKTEEDPNEYLNTSREKLKKPRYQNKKKTEMGT